MTITYLEIIKELERDLPEKLNAKSLRGDTCQQNSVAGPQHAAQYQIGEKSHAGAPKVSAERDKPKPFRAARGFLTIEDIPDPQRRLEISGWKVERRGDELICWSAPQRKPRIQ